MPPFDLSALNPEQREAVLWPGGPLMVFAGAGSGKTRVITVRIARLLHEGVSAYRIIALTFTNKAAREMRERIEAMRPGEARNLWMGTFHSLGARMLRIDGTQIGLDPSFVIYDDGDQVALVKEVMKRLNIDEKQMQPRAILSAISGAKEKLLGPKEFEDRAAGYFEQVAARVFAEYQKALARANALDFDDILTCSVRLLEEGATAKDKYPERFLHVLVDEYQDVNFAQYKFANLLASKHGNITVVGDDDQSIYSWRGADVSLMLRFGVDYPGAKVVTLAQNYRSTQRILGAAHEVVRHNRTRADKRLWTENGEGAAVQVVNAGTEQDEAMRIADMVIREVRTGRRKYGDFAVLYRTNAQSRVVEEAFLTMRVPHILVGGQRFYERKEVKDMIAYLRIALNPRDDGSIRRVVNVPTRGIGNTTLAGFEQWAARMGLGLWEALHDQELQCGLTKRTLAGVRQFLYAVEQARDLAEDGAVTPVLKALLKTSGYWQMLADERTEDAIARMENLQELLQVTTEYDETAEDGPTLAGFLENVSLIADADQLVEGGEAVTLMTVHTSKGLEFPVVCIAGLEEGVFPHSRSLGDEREMEEERRLCYVAMTRAKEELYMLHAERRSLYGQPNFNRRSRFIDDVPAEFVEEVGGEEPRRADTLRSVRADRTGSYRVVEPTSPPRAPDWKPPFSVGQRVRHTKFGEGVVIACSPIKNDAEVTVAFPGVTGVKRLVQSLAKLEAS